MSGSCAFANDMGVVRDMLAAVDCNTRDFAMLGYQSLTGNHSPFQTALTALLTIYVALIGYRLLFAPDGTRLSDGPGIALKIGAIVALVTSWGLFQTLVFDMAARVPLEIAGLISAPIQDSSSLTSDPVGGMQAAYDQLSESATSLGKAAGSAGQVYANHKGEQAELLSIAAGVLFLSCAGLVAITMIAIGVLTAIGPVFVALLLLFETRGFFIGWVRALAAAAFALLSTWTLIVLMLHVLEPWLQELSQQHEAGPLDEQTATTAAAIVFVFAICQFAMIIAGFVVASGFSLGSRRQTQTSIRQSAAGIGEPVAANAISRPARLAEQLQRTREAASVARSTAFAAPSRMAPAMRDAGNETLREHFYRRPFPSRTDRARPMEST